MDWTEERIDTRVMNPDEMEIGRYNAQLVFKLNHTMPASDEYMALLKELFRENLGENSYLTAPLQGVCFERMKIGCNVFINSNLLVMGRGGIVIEDDVQIAPNVQLITNNHDIYERYLLLCKPIHIKKGAWIGAGATILPGVCIGQYAVVGAGSVVTHDVNDYEVVAGNPARVMKTLEAGKFSKIDS